MKIYWTKRSEAKFIKIKSHINKEFGRASSIKFQDKVFDFLELLEKFSELGSLEVEEKKIYGFQITRQTRIFIELIKITSVCLHFLTQDRIQQKNLNNLL